MPPSGHAPHYPKSSFTPVPCMSYLASGTLGGGRVSPLKEGEGVGGRGALVTGQAQEAGLVRPHPLRRQGGPEDFVLQRNSPQTICPST